MEEGVATPEDVDKAFKAGMGFRYATIGIFEFIDWGGVDILHRASGFMTQALNDDRFRAAKLVDEKIANNELGPKTGRGFFDYAGDKRDDLRDREGARAAPAAQAAARCHDPHRARGRHHDGRGAPHLPRRLGARRRARHRRRSGARPTSGPRARPTA